jgi:tetratricopeptide (TPR) repeat protein
MVRKPPPNRQEESVKRVRVFAFGFACFMVGVIATTALADKKVPFNAGIYQDKAPKEEATALLDGALKMAGDGSWERIAVGRAWYLGGDKAKGQEIFDAVTGGKKVKGSDWFRIARVYVEAGDWDKAQPTFDKALALEPDDDSGMIEYGALMNVRKDRAKAEALFTKALTKNPGEFWHWVGAGGSYLGVKPQ